MDLDDLYELDPHMRVLIEGRQAEVWATAIAIAEVEAAQKRHGEPVGKGAGPIWNGFLLLKPTHPGIDQEFVYRSHCRELLAGRQRARTHGAAAEAALAMCEVHKVIPLHGSVAGVYFRLFSAAFLEQAVEMLGDVVVRVQDYERLFRQEMDDHERLIRYKIRQEWRTL